MKQRKFSLYLALGLIIFTIVTAIMAVNSLYTYSKIKNRTIENMKESSKTTILSIKDNVKNLIASYAINEYDNLIQNEISRRDIFAILIDDYNMGKILGNSSYISGKIKYSENHIEDYDPKNNKQNEELRNILYTDTYNISSTRGEKLGTISIYISDESIKKELNKIIIENIKNSILLSFILIVSLFIAIRLFILKPISNITNTITKRDKDGIPTKHVSDNPFTEINKLSNSVNDMISSIKKSRGILKTEQNRLEYLLELSPIAVRIAKNKGKDVIFANNAYSKLLHEDKDNTLHKNPRNYYAQSSDYDEVIRSLENNEAIYNKLVKLSIKDKIIWALASYMNIDFDGEDAVIGWFYDVTNEKNNEKELHNALELQTTIFDNSGYLIIRTDKNGLIKQMNKEAHRVLGYEPEELIDKQTPEIIHVKEEIEQKAKELSQELEKNVPVGFETFVAKSNLNMKNEYEWTYIAKDGSEIPVILSVTALRDKSDKIYGYIGISRDITESKLVESQAKLASMGEMIGNIAHQWRQPLSVITTISSGVKLNAEFETLKEEELLENMDTITLQAKYLSKTIDDFRDFIKNKNDKEEFFVSNLVQKTVSILNSSMVNNNIEIVIDIKDDLKIEGFQNQLIQALINIINNSKDALNEQDISDKYIFIETSLRNEHLVLSIKDNGGGIQTDIIDKVFDPYFTTKHQSIGTGIGLSMTYQIVNKHHNASIKVLNQKYEYNKRSYTGACFEIMF